jgi:hypothetical protein
MGILKEWSEFGERIHDEIDLLNQEVEAVRPLADKLQLMDPDPVELRAAAATRDIVNLGGRTTLRNSDLCC